MFREGLQRLRGAPAGSAARKDLSPLARTHLTVVAAAAAGASAAAVAGGAGAWATAGILLGLGGFAQLFIVEKPGSQSYRLAIVFLLAAAILLPPALVALVAALHYVPSWFRFVRSWHVRIFNLACTVLSSLAAWVVHDLLRGDGRGRFALAGAIAAAAFVVVNHVLLAVMIRLAARIRLRDTKLFAFESLSTDTALAALGVAVAAVWRVDGWTVAFTLAPLVLIYRALHVPQLEIEARIDAKTGLLNAREFEAALLHELERAGRMVAPFSLLMLDLDHFRDFNNRHGHLVGDVVLRTLADRIRAELRHGDIAARFGGEEFVVVIPGADHEAALQVAERIRAAVADRPVHEEAAARPLHATVSIGVATYPWHGRTPKELTHEADQALYRAKDAGRNRVVGAADSPPPHLVAV